MVNAIKFILNFIDDIPDSKLEVGIKDRGTVYRDRDLRLDNHETTRRDKAIYNLQVQVNEACRHTSLAMAVPDSVARCSAPVKDPWSAQKIRDELKKSVTGFVLPRPGKTGKSGKAGKGKKK
ncbi:hypothetical protein EK21DRAFT_55638 [Setomelanomma holmii]|uniref:Uncharacterized protein n=1 Tax=Setomelanomma holmii TaxID=210430 RepID=A0A9P4LR87_9PLEO|nr:hypothetical protein EK21DRAFT_55638 [Setomelanomma holmii]